MTDPILLATVGLIAGLALGAASFAGLWWTVRRATTARRPGRLLALSALARGAALLAGLVALAKVGPWTLLAALLGIVIARQVATRSAATGVAEASAGPAGRPARRRHEGGRA